WKALERERGVRIRQVRMIPETGRLDEDDLNDALDAGARLMAVGAASNALGTITDVAAVCSRARAAGMLTFVDAVHFAPHELVDVGAIGCDFLACSAYKFYGPHVGILFGRRELVDSLDVPKLAPAPDESPERLETGTLNHEGIVGAAAAVEFLASLGSGTSRREKLADAFSRLHQSGDRLFRTMWNGLQDIPGITCHGPKPGTPRTPTVAFTAETVSASELARGLASRGVFVANGDFYAQTVIERLGAGPEGVVRAGCACYTTPEDVGRLVEGVREVSGRGGSRIRPS
ncbi:MAG: aminotransferase class V-fold PLP-dependent enzyme, partial [Gemmatimonadales bacterium]